MKIWLQTYGGDHPGISALTFLAYSDCLVALRRYRKALREFREERDNLEALTVGQQGIWHGLRSWVVVRWISPFQEDEQNYPAVVDPDI